MLKTEDFDFDFPESLIAKTPLPRGQAKMMVKNRSHHKIGECSETLVSNLIDFLHPGDALVLNETKVLPARLLGNLASGAKVEVLLLKEYEGNEWEVMYKSSNKCLPGTKIQFGSELIGEFTEVQSGHRKIKFKGTREEFAKNLEVFGKVPLPPYINREATEEDTEKYQSIFAKVPGSAAAPTASLHLSQENLLEIEKKGVRLVKLILHVGAGTFAPVKSENIESHNMHSEWYSLSEESAGILNDIRAKGGKITAVGTTSARVLETTVDKNGVFMPQRGETDIFIYPGYQWRGTDQLLTNFHWPKSTLFMLVCSLVGIEEGKKLYSRAVQNQYRLFSYGDSMLII